MKASEIIDALIALSDDRIWATELQLFSGGSRVDFWTLEPAASKGYRATAYEIKISRGDYKRDDDDKQEGARRFSDRFWYVTPPDLIKRAEVPEWAGLMEWDGKRFKVVKKAPQRLKCEPDWEFIVSLLRNSGEMRRDVGLLKAQIAFFQSHLQQTRRQRDIVSRFQMDRWARRAKKPAAVSTV